MTHDLRLMLMLGGLVLVLTLVLERVHRQKTIPQWLSRKLLHISAIGACALAAAWLEDLLIFTWIVALVELTLVIMVLRGVFFEEENHRRSWGIALFPLAFLALLLLFPEKRVLIVVPMAILALSDAAAAIVGHLFGKITYTLTGDKKSIIGNLAFGLTTSLLLLTFSLFAGPGFWPATWTFGAEWACYLVVVAAVLTALEALGSKGSDNVLVPIGAALLLRNTHLILERESAYPLIISLLVAGVFVWFTVKRGSLDLGGGVSAGVMGMVVLIFGGPLSLLPLVFFFLLGTIAGKLTAKKEVISDAKHGKARDYLQVFCNGGIFALLAIFQKTNPDIIWLLMVSSMAISTADTLASEIGMYFRGKTVDILRWRVQPPGLSGGISIAGTLGGLLGAALLALLGALLAPGGFSLAVFGIATLTGFFGMILDSLLGASIQARFKNPTTGQQSDFAREGTTLDHGFAWLTNDLVNLLSNFLCILSVFGLLKGFQF